MEPSIDREYIGRVFAIVVLGGMGSIGGTLVAAFILGVAESFVATFYGPSWAPAGLVRHPPAHARRAAARHLRQAIMNAEPGVLGGPRPLICSASACSRPSCSPNEFYFFAGYAILQAMIMAIAWNILGGFTGYVNFGSAGFFAVGVYTTVALNKYLEPDSIRRWSS